MDDVLGYEGKRVVVTGAASGMGEQTARLLVELGAEVIGLDIKPISVPVARSMEMTLLEASSIEEAAAAIDGSIDSIFSCAGLPGAPFTQWVANAAIDYGPRGIRVNCLNPGPTASAMMPAFHANAGKDVVDGSLGIIMRYSEPVEQAWPLVCLNSPRFSYVTGEALWADGGFLAALSVGRHPGMQGLQL
jgi:NAD(P)-dependent dehydrogenase (short-subunit alcohol dehydrogenase family)